MSAKRPVIARHARDASLMGGSFLAVFSGSSIMLLRQLDWGRLWTNDERVTELVCHILPYAAAYQFGEV